MAERTDAKLVNQRHRQRRAKANKVLSFAAGHACSRRLAGEIARLRPASGATKASVPKPAISSRRSTAGSPKASTRRTSRRRRRCWRSCRDSGYSKTPAQRHIVTCGGRLRSNQDSALGMPSLSLDFVLSCRCQVVDNSLQPGGDMLFGHPPEVGNTASMTSAKRVFKRSVIALGLWCYAPVVQASRRDGLTT
jgi:hypothetical protein